MSQFLSGAVFTLCCVAGVFFLRFWRKTRDRFFAFFAASFALMALQRVVMLGPWNNEYLAGVYLLRLLAFVLILAAIVDKNRARRGGPRKGPGLS